MADDDLDDFFAKKDKSKKKNKSYSATDILSKQDSDGVLKKKIKKRQKEKKSSDTSSAANNNEGKRPEREQQDEWKDFKEESEADYTGLRVQNLQINNRDQDDEDDEEEEYGSDEGGERRDKKDTPQGPWNKVGATQSDEPAETAAPAPAPEPEHEQPKAPTKYVPPARRGMMEGGPSRPAPRRAKKDAPDLACQEEFPTLGQVIPEPEKFDSRGGNFETVKGGGRYADSNSKSVQLQLGNKFDALSMDS